MCISETKISAKSPVKNYNSSAIIDLTGVIKTSILINYDLRSGHIYSTREASLNKVGLYLKA